MSDSGMNRRGACRTLLAIGGLAVTGLAHTGLAHGQSSSLTTTPPDADDVLLDQRVADAVRRGATIEEMAQLREPVVRTPEEALRLLKVGNARFFGGQVRRPAMSAPERRAQILGQSPFAVTLGCSDSRVPTEIVFDQTLGSLFIARVAGNIVDTATTGSIEYAVEHLNTRLVVVMGHEGCGAVKAALLPAADRAKETPAIQALLDQIVPAVRNLPAIRDGKARMREAVISNV
ncbi:MAG TPA: carbonic anhydrase, partial [Thermoanaerobaculia bacterium]|nr:carbonic anhydrase [Thermoanaerobaculia bacterium]